MTDNDDTKSTSTDAERSLKAALRPNERIQKLLISTTSRFIGEFDSEGLLVAHANPAFRDRSGFIRMSEGPLSRSAYIIAFVAPQPAREPGVVIPTYDGVGDVICSYLSLLYGKRFDNHGAIESSGFFNLPDMAAYTSMCLPKLPQNSHSLRADFPVPLNLEEIRQLRRLLFDKSINPRHLHTFQGAVAFYLRGLQAAEHDPEAAFLHLITAGEILSNGHDFDPQELMDAATRHALGRIEAELDGGERVARFLSGRMRQIKRRFIETICGLMDPDYFDRGEAAESYNRPKASQFVRRIGAAYDLRSRFLHTGTSFGGWVAPRGSDNSEIQAGRPVVEDRDLAETLWRSPTYVGLERLMRYVLLQFGAKNGLLTQTTHENPTQ